MTSVRIRRSRAADPRSFDEFADAYDRRDELTRGWVTDWLRAVLAGRHGDRAIDLGCGSGRCAHLLADHYRTVRAIDLSDSMIRIARTRRPHPRVTYEQLDIDQATGEYDLVLSILVLHHVPDLPGTLQRVAGLVAPGGLAILVDPAERRRARWQFHLGHLRALYGDLRRGDPNALERFTLTSDRRWIDHLVSDRFLTVPQFRAVYGGALPGAVIVPVSGFQAALWERPRALSPEAAAG